MAINVSKLWREGRFQSFDKNAKLLYIYLITSPNINTLGLINLAPQSAQTDLNLTVGEFRKASKDLMKAGLVKIFSAEDLIYYFVTGHFATLPKSVAVSKKANKDLKALPEETLATMESLGLVPDIEKHVEFNPPTIEEIEKYALSKGYLVEAKTVVEFYEGKAKMFGKKGWYDSRGKAVKDWRSKLRKVWFKEENKLKECKDAPKGFEFFHVKENDKNIVPDYWKNGLPYVKEGFLENKILQREYKKRLAE